MTGKQSPEIGFIGLGAMGLPMAKSLVRAGLSVRGYDIAPLVVQNFAVDGGIGADSLVQVAEEANVLVIMVVTADQVEDVLFGSGNVASALQPGSVVMLCSTVPPSYARRTAQRLYDMGLEMLDAPVSGGTLRAADGTLSVMASGRPQAFALTEPLLAAMAANVYRIGDECGQGSTMKMINQLLAGVHIVAAAEAIGLASKANLDLQTVYEVICNSAGGSWMFENRVPHILEDDYSPRSAINIWRKDLGIVLDMGKDEGYPLPLTAASYQLYLSAWAQGLGGIDDAGVVKIYEQLAGIEIHPKGEEQS